MKFASSVADRNIIKTIVTTLTSIDHVSKGGLGLKFDPKHLKRAVSETLDNLEKYDSVSSTSNLSRKMLQKEKSKLSCRLTGSGRISFAEQYPDLSSIMLSLFDSSGDGLCAHPRLICDTLFLEKTTWMDMPRCVSLLQVFQYLFLQPIHILTTFDLALNKPCGIMKVQILTQVFV